MGKREEVHALYEVRPYPPVGFLTPFLSGLRQDDLPLLNYQAGYASCYGGLDGAAQRPKILVAGCGTLEPVAVAMANLEADLVAVDVSARSLRKLRWQARLRGLGRRIRMVQSDIESFTETGFDYVIATGLLHHLENPALALRHLSGLAGEKAVFRLMVYSRWGRDLLYGAKDLAGRLGVGSPSALRSMLASLPSDHPYRIYFHLYGDSATDTGISDGFLHPWDQPFTALGLRELLAQAGLELGAFLHGPGGLPEAADALADFRSDQGEWERLAVLDALGQLEENFCLFAGRFRSPPASDWVWNPALSRKGRIHSRLLGEVVEFDRERQPSSDEIRRLRKAIFLLPDGRTT
jgi:hypothetical protein